MDVWIGGLAMRRIVALGLVFLGLMIAAPITGFA